MSKSKDTNHKIFGYEWKDIQRAQQGGSLHKLLVHRDGDTGSDPLGDGTFRMHPSGDIVDKAERDKRLNQQ